MDLYQANPDTLVFKAKAEKYAKIISKTIILSGMDAASFGQNAYFYDAAEGLLTATILLVAEFCKPEERHIVSVFKIIQELLAPSGKKGKNQFQQLMEMLPNDHKAKWFAGAALNTAEQSMASVMSTALSRLNSFLDSELEQLLCFDTEIDAEKFCREKSAIFIIMPEENPNTFFMISLGINELDMEEKPLAIYCIIPDETNTYDSLAALFVSQLTQHFIRLAHDKYHGRLPIRMNLILEELASVGKSLSNLPNLMVAARSRNIRIMLVLQNGNSQLTDVYGKSKAATINSCVGITFAFSTNSWETLNEWSQRCGERQVEIRGNIVKEPLITASQLAAMPVGTALILINNQYKYVARLPFYNEMFDMSGWHEPSITKRSFVNKSKAFDMKNYVKQQREKKINEMLNGDSSERTSTPINPFSLESPSTIDTSDLVARIDAKIAELEAQEEAEKKDKERKIIHYSVVVLNYGSSRISAVRAVRETLHVPIDVANNVLRTLPAEINVDSKKTAESLMKAIVEIGGIATVKKEET